MSQKNVELVIGRLVTDEGLRRRFVEAPAAVLEELVAVGVELNECEIRALNALTSESLRCFAERLDPCIQRVDLRGEPS